MYPHQRATLAAPGHLPERRPRIREPGAPVNFLTEEEGEERIQAAYGKNLERLIEVKTRWDPENVFRINKNIAPRPRSADARS